MVYSNMKYPQKQSEFPPPPLYLTWIEDWSYSYTLGVYAVAKDGTGVLRHHESLKKARRYLGRYEYGGKGWSRDWALYEWNGKKYIQIAEGLKGGSKKDVPLFAKPLKDGEAPPREADEDDVNEAIKSILLSGGP